jgi:hypothetical protein
VCGYDRINGIPRRFTNSAAALLQPVYATPLSCNQIKTPRTIALRSSEALGVPTGQGCVLICAGKPPLRSTK